MSDSAARRIVVRYLGRLFGEFAFAILRAVVIVLCAYGVLAFGRYHPIAGVLTGVACFALAIAYVLTPPGYGMPWWRKRSTLKTYDPANTTVSWGGRKLEAAESHFLARELELMPDTPDLYKRSGSVSFTLVSDRPIPSLLDNLVSATTKRGLFDGIKEHRPRKVSRETPNVANAVELGIAELLNNTRGMPAFYNAHVWITGSRVWRSVLGEPIPDDADMDIFVTDEAAYKALLDTLTEMYNAAGGKAEPRPAENRSHARGVGMIFTTPKGRRIDVWFETTDPYFQLQLFPSDGYSHCRAAYNLLNRTLIVRPNENAK